MRREKPTVAAALPGTWLDTPVIDVPSLSESGHQAWGLRVPGSNMTRNVFLFSDGSITNKVPASLCLGETSANEFVH